MKEVDRLGTIRYFNDKEQLHRIDGPAIETAYGGEAWWVNGQRHRLDGPAIETAYGYKEYWINGRRYYEEEYRLIIFSLYGQ